MRRRPRADLLFNLALGEVELSGRFGAGRKMHQGLGEGHRLARSVAYGDFTNANPAPTTPAYEQQADPVIELQLEKAGVRLAFVLDKALQ